MKPPVVKATPPVAPATTLLDTPVPQKPSSAQQSPSTSSAQESPAAMGVASHAMPLKKTERCMLCGNQVFDVDRQTGLDDACHKACFKCKVCSCKLNLRSYINQSTANYCAPSTVKRRLWSYEIMTHQKKSATFVKTRSRKCYLCPCIALCQHALFAVPNTFAVNHMRGQGNQFDASALNVLAIGREMSCENSFKFHSWPTTMGTKEE